MVLTVRDVEILKLLCWCKNIHMPERDCFSDIYSIQDIYLLEYLGFVSISRNKKYVRPKPDAYLLLGNIGYHFRSDAKPQTKQRVLERRNIAAEILLTFYMAGADVFGNHINTVFSGNTYVASFAMRNSSTAGNPFGSTKFYGTFHTSNAIYLVFYVDDIGVYFQKELTLFHSFIDKTGAKNTGLIFMGKSISDIGDVVFHEMEEDKDRKKKYNTDSFSKIFSMTSLPIHFVPIGEIGVHTLRFLGMQDYRQQLAKLILRKSYNPPYDDLPDTDTIHYLAPNNPAVISLDMDIKRIDRAVYSVKEKGFQNTEIYALPEQMPFLKKRYKDMANVIGINTDRLNSDLGFTDNLKNYAKPFMTQGGQYIDVSDFNLYRKNKKQV